MTSGNFAKCTARFCGGVADDLDAFLEVVLTYKDCTQVFDENALRGLSMLLEGTAATWWQGVKGAVSEWSVSALHDAFSLKLPRHLVFREIFSREQRGDEASDLFVCHIRVLFAQLPGLPQVKLTPLRRCYTDSGMFSYPQRRRLVMIGILYCYSPEGEEE
ncbi:hypothetical protein J437_LFUL014419 [Ladona fulva]|uniref:Uncharacterized protein n=1 Tax=Ladona fulva TaxID=123851 RepID=A0A8K0P206_LADFU|nr:hypothetical protein J437_LFUL014419 [Ladona fulva]